MVSTGIELLGSVELPELVPPPLLPLLPPPLEIGPGAAVAVGVGLGAAVGVGVGAGAGAGWARTVVTPDAETAAGPVLPRASV